MIEATLDRAKWNRAHGFSIETNKPIAIDSPDHIVPWGTARDNSTNPEFNRKLQTLLGDNLKIIDLGCSGGGFVKSCLDEGHTAIGIEGSDYSARIKRAEWGTIPDNLMLADITEPFKIKYAGEPFKANLITAWEVIEHIATSKLMQVSKNVRRHLAPGGIWIMSVSPNEEVQGGVKLHQSVYDRIWWEMYFTSFGFNIRNDIVDYFGEEMVRGPKYGAPGSFHLCLSVNG